MTTQFSTAINTTKTTALQDWPRVTVVTPSYNQAAFIERTIRSVLDQGYPNLEYIVIDGGSSDGSLDIIRKYEEKLSYWTSEADNGQYDAIQKGFAKSTGSIMTWINSDDVLSHKSLFTIVDIFNRYNQISWITGQTAHIAEDDRIVGLEELRRWSAVDVKLGTKKWIQQEGTFWRRSLWDKVGAYINLEYRYAGDLALWSRFFQFEQLYSIKGITGFFRRRSSDQKSTDMLHQYEAEAFEIMKAMKLKPEELKIAKAKMEYHRTKRFGTIRNRLLFKHEPEINLGEMLVFDPVQQKFVLHS